MQNEISSLHPEPQKSVLFYIFFLLMMSYEVNSQDPLPMRCGMSEDSIGLYKEFNTSSSGHFCTPSSTLGTVYNDLDRYAPEGEPIRIHANFIILQRQDGTGNFQDIPEHRELLNEWLDRCNDVLSNTWWTDCTPPASSAEVEIVPNWIFLPDTTQNEYYWNYLNHNTTWGCPSSSNWWLNDLDQIIHNDPLIPKGINVYFTIDADIYHQMVTLGTINNPVSAGMDYVACSELPTLTDMNRSSRIHLPNMFLKYFWFKNHEEVVKAPFTASREWIIDEGKTLAHEFGHSFISEYTHYSGCTGHLMAEKNGQRALSTIDVGYIHRGFVYNNLRQFIDCDQRYNASIYASEREWNITQDEEWTRDTRLYHNLRVSAGATLTIRCKLLLPEDGVVIVERGGRLIVDGGKIQRANTCDKTQYWAGIAVKGNPASLQPDPHGLLTVNDGGVVLLMGDGEIEGAETGITTQSHPHWDVPADRGGLVQADGFSFVDNKKGVQFMRYDLPNFSKFNNVVFANESGYSMYGVTLWHTNNIGFEGCTFKDMTKSGIESWDASYSVSGRNIFMNCIESGVTAGSSMPLLGIITIGDINNQGIDQNQFINNTIGFRGTAIRTEIYNNKMENFNFDIAITGESASEIKYNALGGNAAGIQLENTGNNINTTECNVYQDNTVGINIVGDNSQMTFSKERFNSKFHDVFIEGETHNPGKILLFQGSSTNARWNYFTSGKQEQIKTSTVFPWNNTVHFNYFHPSLASPILIPLCSSNYPCSLSSNFSNFMATGNNNNCGTPLFLSTVCTDQTCLDSLRSAIVSLEIHGKRSEESNRLLSVQQQLIGERELAITTQLNNCIKTGDWIAAEALIYDEATPENLRRRVALALWRDQFNRADSLLAVFPREKIEDRQFIQIQRINRNFRSNSDFELSESQRLALIDIAVSGTTQAGYAQSLLSLLTGENTMPHLPILDKETPSISDNNLSKVADNSQELSVHPNPAIDQLSILWKNNTENYFSDVAEFAITDVISGRIVLTGRINNEELKEINVAMLIAGIYLLVIREPSTGQVLLTRKIIIGK